MHDRVRKLIVECTQPSIDGVGNWTDTEKLVNLVVKECAGLLLREALGNHDKGSETYNLLIQEANWMADYFGVKQ